MIPRIKSFKPMKDYQLLVTFDDGRIVLYGVMNEIGSAQKSCHAIFVPLHMHYKSLYNYYI